MIEVIATLTQRGQVTIPAEVQRALGLRPCQKVSFKIDGDQVRLAPVSFTLESAYGSVAPRHHPENFDAMIAEALDDHADQVVEEMTNRATIQLYPAPTAHVRFLDTNIILRYLTKDDPAKAAACFALFQRLEQGDEEVTTSEVHLHEALYVLTSPRQYRLTHAEAAARLRLIIALRGLKIPTKRLYLRALDIYASSTQLDFGDAIALARMESQGIQEIYSYDTDFDIYPAVTRTEP